MQIEFEYIKNTAAKFSKYNEDDNLLFNSLSNLDIRDRKIGAFEHLDGAYLDQIRKTKSRTYKRDMFGSWSRYWSIFYTFFYRGEVKETTELYLEKIAMHVDASKKINLKVSVGAITDDKAKILKEWYHKQLKKQIPPLLKKWEKIIGVKADDWGVQQMKTKWGAYTTGTKRNWLNLELTKRPPICLEYILVHELVHLHERNHNERFVKLMDDFMPKWRLHRDQLNSLPIVHNDWGY